MNTISFLLGSGFSRPEGLPLAKDISECFSNIDKSRIRIYDDDTACFLEEDEPIKKSSRDDEINFFKRFIKFYKRGENKENFDYEIF